MAADWVKIRNKYITSTISQRELAKKFHVAASEVYKRSKAEGWVAERKKYQSKATERAVQKSIEKIAEKESDEAAQIASINASILQSLAIAAQELNIHVHQNRTKKRQAKPTADGGVQEVTQESIALAQEQSIINVQRAKQIASALRDIAEVNALLASGRGDTDFEDDGLLAALDFQAGDLFGDGDDSGMLQLEEDGAE